MSLKFEIEVPWEIVRDGEAARYVANALAAIGYKAQRSVPTHIAEALRVDGGATTVAPGVVSHVSEDGAAKTTHLTNVVSETEVMQALAEQTAAPKADDKPVRERGKPSPGAKRRTKEEVAEDLAAEKAEFDAAQTGQGISTGEERVNPEDDAATQAQDAEDEAAEVEATRTEALTLDDVKNAAMSYAQTFGMPATQEDGQKIMAKAFGEPPAGEKGWTIPMLKTPEQFATAVKFWTAAVNENPFKRTPV